MSDRIVLECRKISHWFGDNHVLYDVNLKVIRGEIVARFDEIPHGLSSAGKARTVVIGRRTVMGDTTPHGDAWSLADQLSE